MRTWLDQMKELLNNKTINFSNQEKENISFEYLKNLLIKIEGKFIIEDAELQSKIEYVINEIPQKTNGKRINYKTKHINEITNLQAYIEQNFNFIKKGTFRSRYMLIGIPLGMPLGLPIGVLIGKVGLSMLIGIPIGMFIGLIVGNYLDKKAENENRIL
jgi:hypothetical protein